MPFYRNILKNALSISWRNKYLWFFGIFAAFLSTSGGYEMMTPFLNGDANPYLPGMNGFMDTGLFSPSGIHNLKIFFATASVPAVASLIIALVIIALLFIFLFSVAVVSQGALIAESGAILKSKFNTFGQNNFKRGLEAGLKKFWQVLSLNLLSSAVFIVLFSLVCAPVLLMVGRQYNSWLEGLFVLLFMFFVAIGLAISFVSKYAIANVVIKNDSLVDSIKNGWDLFKSNWIISLELAFILFSINFLVAFAFMITLAIATIPLKLLALLLGTLLGPFAFRLIFLPIFLLGGVFVVMCLGALLICFQINAWTALYLELNGKKEIKSKIIRVLEKIKR